MYFLAHLYIKILKNINRILIIIQRSNGDVFFSLPLIDALNEYYGKPSIDLLVNDDTVSVARLFNHINKIHTFSYKKKKESRLYQEKTIISAIYKKYDLSINLTASDRSVIYAFLAAKNAISAIEKDFKKSWWKKIILSNYYYFDNSKHILKNNLQPLNLLNIKHELVINSPSFVSEKVNKVKDKLRSKGVKDFIIFHPSAQYNYKIYPQNLRNELLELLSSLGVSILVTGSSNSIDLEIKNSLPNLPNIYDFIGETSIEDYLIISDLSLAYIGMDTLNMHIAASQNKRIFAIFGPTILSTWSPWSNKLQMCAKLNIPIQSYGDVTIFQADLSCVACGKAGCDDNHGLSECLFKINPNDIVNNVEMWLKNIKLETIS